MPNIYNEQFKADAVALVESGMSPSNDPEIAKEMSAAVKRIRELEMENEVLRAAAAYVSQEAIRLKRSSEARKN